MKPNWADVKKLVVTAGVSLLLILGYYWLAMRTLDVLPTLSAHPHPYAAVAFAIINGVTAGRVAGSIANWVVDKW
jgi:hypothetical protein